MNAPHEGALRPLEFFARSHVPVAMGGILAQTSDENARREIFGYLQGGLTPDAWRERVKWSGPYDGEEFADLGRNTIRALGLCGHLDAQAELNKAEIQVGSQQGGWKCLRVGEKAEVLAAIQEARRVAETVRNSGLRRYYTTRD